MTQKQVQKTLKQLPVRERLIRCGVQLYSESGFQNTGIETVLRMAGVPRGSFYHYFKSKHQFGLVVIDSYAKYFSNHLLSILQDTSLTPLARLKQFVEVACQGMSRFDYKRGCLVGNLGQELAYLDDEFREKLEHVLRDWEKQTAVCIEQAQTCGELPSDQPSEQLAQIFWIGWEGAILRAKLMCSDKPMRMFSQWFFKM